MKKSKAKTKQNQKKKLKTTEDYAKAILKIFSRQ